MKNSVEKDITKAIEMMRLKVKHLALSRAGFATSLKESERMLRKEFVKWLLNSGKIDTSVNWDMHTKLKFRIDNSELKVEMHDQFNLSYRVVDKKLVLNLIAIDGLSESVRFSNRSQCNEILENYSLLIVGIQDFEKETKAITSAIEFDTLLKGYITQADHEIEMLKKSIEFFQSEASDAALDILYKVLTSRK